MQVVIAQQLAQSRRIRLGRRNEDDSLALPTFQAFDQRRERGLFAVQRGFQANIAGQVRFHRQRRLLRALRRGKNGERFALDAREWLEGVAPFMLV